MGFYNPPVTCQIPNLEDLYIELFGYKPNGVFVEIGAYDGETCSNTSFLADLGWTGFYVEPVEQYAVACSQRHRHNKVKVLQAAIGNQHQEVEIYIGGVLSSIAKHHIKAFKQLDWARNHHQGDYQTIQMLLPDELISLLFKSQIHHVDLLVIDVEGFEYPIVSTWNFDRLCPSVIVVESRDQSPEFGFEIQQESKQMIDILESKGYRVFWRDDCNIIFSHVNHLSLVII